MVRAVLRSATSAQGAARAGEGIGPPGCSPIAGPTSGMARPRYEAASPGTLDRAGPDGRHYAGDDPTQGAHRRIDPVAKVTMPQLGESVAEGTIGKWLKQPGDTVEKYEPLLEVITDKVNAEVPSPFAGVLKEILVEEGATVPNNAEIAVIE